MQLDQYKDESQATDGEAEVSKSRGGGDVIAKGPAPKPTPSTAEDTGQDTGSVRTPLNS